MINWRRPGDELRDNPVARQAPPGNGKNMVKNGSMPLVIRCC
ncbi:MAG TPA: hypothetical protein PLY13_05990 [Methanoregulaceae archaeon]|nr:hypothetical protein [Methanoregulaceae archaeon]